MISHEHYHWQADHWSHHWSALTGVMPEIGLDSGVLVRLAR